MRVLDAFRPQGATWLGQVISSPTGPKGGPSKTHLLPGGEGPRVHRAGSPVPPRLPHFPTPRSVHQFAAVAAGAYPPRRPPNAWSPGVPALPGPCYWLVASGTPVGWRGGCLDVGLVRGAMRHYCLGGCSALVVCVRRLRPVRGGWGRCRVLCLPRFPLPAQCFLRCVWRAVPSGCPLSSLAGTPFHAVCAFRGLGPVALLVFPACPLCVRALAHSRRPRPPPLPGLVWRAHLARSRFRALVGPFHSVRALPRVLPRSRAPFGLLWGGRPGPVSLYLAWGCALPVGCVRARGPVTNPSARALAIWPCALAWRAVGAARGRVGGAPPAWVRGVRGRALSHPRSLVLSGVRPGQTTHWLWVREVRAWGPVTNPKARALASWLCTLWGRHEGARGGAPLAWVWGVRGPALSHPRPLVLSGVRPGPTTHWLWVRGVRAWGPVTNPTARALASWLCALWGRHEVARGGAPLAWVWSLRGRVLSDPRPLVLSGVRPGPTTHCLWVRGLRAWGPVTNPTARALASWLCALWGRHEGDHGGRLLPGCGASGVGRSGTPDHSSFWACGRGPLPTGCGCGGCGRGDPSPTPQRALLPAGFARCGGGMRVPGGAPLA